MKRESALFGLVGLCLGSLLTIAIVFTVRTAGTNMGKTMGMDEMTYELKNKKGNEFDETFLKFMIDHHLGAIDMAKEATAQAQHKELKTFSENIIQAQSQEIDTMKAWLLLWAINK